MQNKNVIYKSLKTFLKIRINVKQEIESQLRKLTLLGLIKVYFLKSKLGTNDLLIVSHLKYS